jgi:hypothetical protein
MGAVEDRGPLMHARIDMLRALNRHLVREFASSRKDTQLGKAEAEEGLILKAAIPARLCGRRGAEIRPDWQS